MFAPLLRVTEQPPGHLAGLALGVPSRLQVGVDALGEGLNQARIHSSSPNTGPLSCEETRVCSLRPSNPEGGPGVGSRRLVQVPLGPRR